MEDRQILVSQLPGGVELKLDFGGAGIRYLSISQNHADVQLHVVSAAGEEISFDAPTRRATPERICIDAQRGGLSLRVTTKEPVRQSLERLRLVVTSSSGSPKAECLESQAARVNGDSAERIYLAQASRFRQAAEIWASLRDHSRAGDAFLKAAWMLARNTSDNRGALDEGYNARRQYEFGQDALGAARSVLVIAVSRWALIEGGQVEAGALGNKAAMLAATQSDLEWAVAAFDEAGDAFFAAESRNHLANSYYEQGRFAEAMRLFAEAAADFHDAGVREGETRARANFNTVLKQIGNYREAATAFERLLSDRSGDTTDQVLADILYGSAATHSVVGNYDEALPQFVQALQIHDRFGDRAGMARSLNGLAATYMRLGVPAAALEYAKQARAVMREREKDRGPGSEAVEFTSELLTANAQRALGDPLAAQASHRTALKFARNDAARLQARIELVRDALAAKDPTAAREEIAPAQLLVVHGTKIQALQFQLEIARTDLLAGELSKARRELQTLEGQFAAAGTRELEIEVLQALAVAELRHGRIDDAMAVNNRTLDMLRTLRLAVSNPELRTRMTSLHRTAFELRVQILDLLRSRATHKERKAELLSQIFAASDEASAGLVYETRRTRVIANGASNDAELAAVAAEIALREHVLAALDSGGDSGAGKQKLRAELAVMRARADVLGPPTPVRGSFDARDYNFGDFRGDTAILMFIRTPQSTRTFLVTRGRIVESAFASLEPLVKFPHLIFVGTPASAAASFDTTHHDITMALTMRDALHIARLPDESRRADLARVALFFDPVFTPYDTRFARVPTTATAFPVKARLIATRTEARAISTRLRSSELLQFSDFAATRAAVMSDTVNRATVLHFATHAIASDQWPNGSGLLLTGFTATGGPLNGFVSTLDLLSRRTSTDLVVLSACDTAHGDAATGENVAGLARAFLGGGARRVVASLRRVDDAVTAKLMGEFYGGLAAGMTPAAALRAAQRVRAVGSSPAAFVLYERAPDS